MSIATQILRIKSAVSNAYIALQVKNATMPEMQNVDNLASTISSIDTGGGITPSGSLNITANGTYDVTNYASAKVSVSKYGATLDTFLGDVDSNGVLQAPSAETNLVFSGVTDLGDNALAYVYSNSSGIKSLAFPNLGKISGTSAMLSICDNCKSLASVQFPILKEVTANSACKYMLRGCTLLESIKFPLLETITGHEAFREAFISCSNLESVQFPKLKKIGDDTATGTNTGHFYFAFRNASKVTSLEFPELTAIYCTSNPLAGTFYGNGQIQKMYFPKLSVIDKSPAYSSVTTSNAQNNIFLSCSSLTEIHFGAANQAAIEATSGYPTLWGRGAGNATVYFDL